MDAPRDSSPAMAFEKDALQLTVEDVYDISYVIGRDLLKISKAGAQVSDLQFRIVRVLEMFEVLVNKYNLSVEELKMERDNLKRELDRVVGEKSAEQGSTLGPDKMVVDLKDPNRPRFTMQELKEVLQERNQLKAHLLIAQEELQLYKSGLLTGPHQSSESAMVEVELEPAIIPVISPQITTITEEDESKDEPKDEFKEEKTTIRKLFSFRRK
ncbi:RILP-like protein 2 [Clupea harengus]|uniref:RILP-like protein 2 n=1 Tax=Clupea harengus TaxID=7950 RepID=A0A6P3W3K9_CLUHA|nr:RILP-like protein 2 [Clupea harengus]